MRQPHNARRSRGRSNRKHNVPLKHQNFESNGPDVRIRGNAHQVYEKYLAMARDANSSGDRISAEGYYQHAEHYFRIMNDSTDPQNAQRQQQQQQQQRGRENGHDQQGREATPEAQGAGTPAAEAAASGEASPQPAAAEASQPAPAGADQAEPSEAAPVNGADVNGATEPAAEPPAKAKPARRRAKPRKQEEPEASKEDQDVPQPGA